MPMCSIVIGRKYVHTSSQGYRLTQSAQLVNLPCGLQKEILLSPDICFCRHIWLATLGGAQLVSIMTMVIHLLVKADLSYET